VLAGDRASVPAFAGWRAATAGASAFAAALVVAFTVIYAASAADARLVTRNFYAALRVWDSGDGAETARVLTHGTITHGKQFVDASRRTWLTTYYDEKSGVGRAIEAMRARGPVKIGVIGLGVGTLAAYGRAGDTVRIYEIDPQVVALARREFSYLDGTKAKVELALGDARLTLEREADQGFDVLAVDAFSSDSIPVHLLTAEAFAVYFRHLRPGGVLAVHISNRYLDLKPVLREAAARFGRQARLVDSDNDDERAVYGSTWVLIAESAQTFAQPPLDGATAPLESERGVRLWTDDYSDLWRILK
jgi:spermidine synthase